MRTLWCSGIFFVERAPTKFLLLINKKDGISSDQRSV